MAWLAFVCAVASAALAVICLVQSVTGRQVLRPGSSQRSPAQIRGQSRWAAGEWSGIAVGLTALLVGSDPLFLLGMLAALACYVGLMRVRRAHARSA